MSEFRCSPKQREIMDQVLQAVDHGFLAGMEYLRARLTYGPRVSKQAIRCSLKYLHDHGFVEYEREGSFTFYRPTPAAYKEFR